MYTFKAYTQQLRVSNDKFSERNILKWKFLIFKHPQQL